MYMPKIVSELKPCPFCAKTPPDDQYFTRNGGGFGGIVCCIQGPAVRTEFQNWPAWKSKAIAAWNVRVTEPQA